MARVYAEKELFKRYYCDEDMDYAKLCVEELCEKLNERI